jgi:hypothetical protein
MIGCGFPMSNMVNDAANEERPWLYGISGGTVLKTRLISVILILIFSNRSRESIANPYYFNILLLIGAIEYLSGVMRILL